MPEIGKSVPPELFEPEPEDVVDIAKVNLRACFAMAKRDQRLRDRTNANQLAKHIAANRDHYGDTVSKSHIYRTAQGDGPVSTDVLHVIAKAYGLQAWHMLTAGMQPANPPVIIVDERQRKLYASIEESMRIARPTTVEASNAQESTARNADAHRNTSSPTGRRRHHEGGTGGRGKAPEAPPRNRRKAKA